MAANRAAKLKRLATIQRQIERMAESELALLHRERQAVTERMDALGEALASPKPAYQPFSRLFGAQLGRLKTKDQMLAGRTQVQERRVLGERAKADRLTDHWANAAAEERRAAEDEDLFDLLDRLDATQASDKFRRP
jgi:hypothetical protein